MSREGGNPNDVDTVLVPKRFILLDCNDRWHGDQGHDSAERITAEALKEIVPNIESADIYMCGSASFVNDLRHGLEGIGVSPSLIRVEDF